MGEHRHTGFLGQRRVKSGSLLDVALALQAAGAERSAEPATIIDDTTGNSVQLSLHGSPEELRARLTSAEAPAESAPRKPGRPKLGVVPREVTLLPRHWEWLDRQPGSASATLRRLVDQARRDGEASDRARLARDAAYRFMHVMAGDLPGFEEASRALFSGDWEGVRQETAGWPGDIRDHAHELVARAQELARRADEVEASREG